MPDFIGDPFDAVEVPLADALDGLGSYVAVVNDPPWSELAENLARPAGVVIARDMELKHLESLVQRLPDSTESIVGIGGGTALDTAKFLAWKSNLPLVLAPTIASVDASFTDAVGVRDGRRVKYLGSVRPQHVIIDLDILGSAPQRLNRAGIGDILSCHTGLADWRGAVDRGAETVPWRSDLAELGRQLLRELDDAADEVRATSSDGIRFLLSAYRRIGAACAEAGHSRFEEGSEHFFAYAYEYRTGLTFVHGEVISLAVVAMSALQGNDPDWARSIVMRAGVQAHPHHLGIEEATFNAVMADLASFCRQENLDHSVIDEMSPLDVVTINMLWDSVASLPYGND